MQNKILRIWLICGIHKFYFLGEFETKIGNTLGGYQEYRWVLLAKPVKNKKTHASVPLRF
jgi:hypothetical protein